LVKEERKQGKLIKIKTFLVIKGEIIRVTVSTDRTDYIVTNDLSQNSTDEVQEANAVRCREEFHRGVKQLTGIEVANVAKREFNAIILLARFWLGLI